MIKSSKPIGGPVTVPPLGYDPARSVPVALGVAMAGHLRIWHDETPSLWKVPEYAVFDDYKDLLGSGAISTMRYDDGLYCETASFDRVSSVLAVCKTLRISHHGSTLGSCLWIKVAETTQDDGGHDTHWDDVEDLIIQAAEGAQARGEVLVVGPGPHPRPDGPAVLLGTSTMNAWTSSVISASPVPDASQWGVSEAEGNRVTLMATLSPFALRRRPS